MSIDANPTQPGPQPYVELPWQAQPLIQVSGVDDAESYARRVATGLGPDPVRLVAPAGMPDAPTRDELVVTLPEADYARLDELGTRLVDMLESLYPPPPDPCTGSYASVHLAGGAGVTPGTVAFVRTTSGATVQYLLPNLVVDPTTLRPRILAPPVPPRPPARPRTAMAVQVDISQLLQSGLAVAGTGAWGLPAPWNVGAATVVTTLEQLLNLFWPPSDAPSPLRKAVDALKAHIDQTEIGRAANQIRGFALYVEDQQAHLRIPIGPSPYVQDVLLPELRLMTTPGRNSVYDALQQLESMLATVGVEQKNDVLDLLIAGVSLQLVGLKMILQLDAAAAAYAEQAGEDERAMELTNLWLDDYVNLEEAVFGAEGTSDRGWVKRATDAIAAYVKARCDQVRKPYRYHTTVHAGRATHEQWGWTFTDDGIPNDSPKTQLVYDTPSSGCCDPWDQHGDRVDAAYAIYITARTSEITTPRALIVTEWNNALDSWRQHLPPPAPTGVPRLAALPSGPPTPQGSGWINGNSVQYAVGYVNSAPPAAAPPKTRAGAGPSGAGPETKWLPVGATAFVRLTDFPADPTRMATHIRIYRRFKTAIGHTTQWRVVKTVSVGTASYDDKDLAHV